MPGDRQSLGRYELVGRLGEGPHGVVYLGRDPASGTQAAVKVLRAQLSGGGALRSGFLREAAAAQRSAGHCLAQVLDADLAGAPPYIVSEYVPGPPLPEVVHSGGPRGGDALARIAVSTATALAGLHQAGTVHRDFKAANVLIGPDGPIVTDFGVGKVLDALDAGLAGFGQPSGTPGYLAPEQFSGAQAGPAADIFAWGVTVSFAATGSLPFGAGQAQTVWYRVLNEQPRLTGFTGLFRSLVTACLDKDPAARPTAREIIDYLAGHEDLFQETAPATRPADLRGHAPAAGMGTQATPDRSGSPPGTEDPIQAVRMEPLQLPALSTPPPARGPWYSRQVRTWAVTAAAAVAVLAGAAVAVNALTRPHPGREAAGHPAAGAARRPAGAANPAPPGLVSFENGTDGWHALWGSIRISPTAQVAYSGSHSLLITARSAAGGIGVHNGSVAHLRPGDKVTFHIYSYGQNASVEPFVQASAGSPEDVAESVQLPARPGWVTVSWVVPAVRSIYAIGTQVTAHGAGRVTLAIDALSWPGS